MPALTLRMMSGMSTAVSVITDRVRERVRADRLDRARV